MVTNTCGLYSESKFRIGTAHDIPAYESQVSPWKASNSNDYKTAQHLQWVFNNNGSENSINIWAERHRSVQTLYFSANTKLRVSYMNIPSRSRATLSEILGDQPCAASLKVHLLKDYQPRRVLCLYRASEETNKIFEKVPSNN